VCASDGSFPSSVEIKKEWSNTSLPEYVLIRRMLEILPLFYFYIREDPLKLFVSVLFI
jgi:hypothetical protein